MLPAIVVTQSVPTHKFTGTVMFGGVTVPSETDVTALIDGIPVGSTTVSDRVYTILIQQPGGVSFAGKKVIFEIDNFDAYETGIWEQGGADVLNLTIGPKPTPVPGAGGGGGLGAGAGAPPTPTPYPTPVPPAPTSAPTAEAPPTATPVPSTATSVPPSPTATSVPRAPTATPRLTPTPVVVAQPTRQATQEPEATPAPPNPLEIVDQLANQYLVPGKVAFNVPERMEIGETIRIELRLSGHKSIPELKEGISNQAKGRREGEEIEIGNRMKATLSGANFEFVDLREEIQLVGTLKDTWWAWQVTANDSGTHTLILLVSAILPIEGELLPYELKTFERQITISVGVGRRLSDFGSNNWQWLWTFVLVPIAAWVMRRQWKRR